MRNSSRVLMKLQWVPILSIIPYYTTYLLILNKMYLCTQHHFKMERQIQLRNQMAERQRAMEIAKSRDLFLWTTAFSIAAATGLFTG